MLTDFIPSKATTGLLLCLLSLVVIFVVDQTSVISYVYTLGLLFCVSRIMCKDNISDVYYIFHLYLFVAIAFTLIFKAQFPDYLGLTGQEGIYGTDDARYYAQIVGGNVSYVVQVTVVDQFMYSILLRTLYPFEVYTPLNIVILNLLFAVFIPVLVYKLSFSFFKDEKLSKTASYLSLFCPFTVYFSCIIMRESFIATMVLAGLYCFKEKKYLLLIIPVISILIIRMGSIVFLLGGMLVVLKSKLAQYSRYGNLFFLILLLILVGGAYVFFPLLQELTQGKLSDSLIRSTDDEFWEGSTLARIMSLPFPLNILFSTAFFIYAPILAIPMPVNGHYLVSTFFQGVFTPFFFFFLWKYIYNALSSFFVKHELDVKNVILIIFIFAILLGTVSLQSRHKTVLFPFLCILAAYGKNNFEERYRLSSELLALITVLGQILMVVSREL